MFEEFQSITAAPKRRIAVDCADCHNKAPVRRCIGKGAGVIFKGSGFYQTDYRSAEYTKKAEADKEGGAKKDDAKDASKKDGTKSDGAKSDGATKAGDAAKKPADAASTAKPKKKSPE